LKATLIPLDGLTSYFTISFDLRAAIFCTENFHQNKEDLMHLQLPAHILAGVQPLFPANI